jgi:hypothetical protein
MSLRISALLLALVAGSLVTSPGTINLHDSPRARRMLTIARAYLPGDWRYPVTAATLPSALHAELKQLLPVVPREQRTEFSCGAATLGITLSHFGTIYSDTRLERVTDTTREGVDPWHMVKGARRLGFNVWQRWRGTVADVLACLDHGDPVIIDFQASYEPNDDPNEDWGHYSVIVAADATDFLVVDPSAVNPEQLRIIPQDKLVGIWWDKTIGDLRPIPQWMMTVRPGPHIQTPDASL